MANPGLSPEQFTETLRVVHECGGNLTKAADLLGVGSGSQVRKRLNRAEELGIVYHPLVEIDPLPDEVASAEEILERRKKQFDRKRTARDARKLIPITVRDDNPVIGIAHFGDPHVDDDGTDIERLERDVDTVRRTDGLYGANVGDLHNNWVGRLARLYANQSTSAAEAWRLVEWLMTSIPWLYIIAGNHDLWSGPGDPAKWIAQHAGRIYEPWGVRAALRFPNGAECRINARHDFTGHSMWNPAHGPMKAIQGGWRDHVLTCGHKHTSFIGGPLKDPATGLCSWAVRVAGYKVYDDYAIEKGLPDQNAFAAAVTVIDSREPDDSARKVVVIPDVEEGAEYLKFKRKRV